ncbi:hypothetical protein NXX71_20770 [Bacteroides faecis]|nr:hypothetical protein [Bacteroides faecis]
MGDKARALNELVSYEELREYIDYDEGKEMSNLDYLHKNTGNYPTQIGIPGKDTSGTSVTLQQIPLLHRESNPLWRSIRFDATPFLSRS